MASARSVIEDAVVDVLAHTDPCTIDEVVQAFPTHDWSAVFFAVDTMSRDGRLVLRRRFGSGYQMSLSASMPTESQVDKRMAPVHFCVGCGYFCDENDQEDGQSPWIEAHRYLKNIT